METFLFYCLGYLLGKYEDRIIGFFTNLFRKVFKRK